MEQKRFAVVSWLPGDILENARELGIELTRSQAVELLGSMELRIIDAMVAAGWGTIENALTTPANRARE